MSKHSRSIYILFFSAMLAILVCMRLGFSAFGTIDKVVISAPSFAATAQPVRVDATVFTKSTG
jgi:hypothetical protein